MGVVYRCVHRDSGEEAAVKTVMVPHASLLQSIRREILALAQIRHPGIVPILDHGVEGGLPWYAMKLVDGRPLWEYLNSAETPGPWSTSTAALAGQCTLSRTLPVGFVAADTGMGGDEVARDESEPRPELTATYLSRVVTVAYRLCVTLTFLHGEGMVHKDLKPSNILLPADGMPVLVDFGLTARFGGITSRDSVDSVSLALGTPNYVAPEQIRGDVVDARADLYGLGCMLYELLTGTPPFSGVNLREVLRGHLRATPVPPSHVVSGIPQPLEAIILRLLAKYPAERPGYASDVAAILAEVGAEQSFPQALPVARTYLYRPALRGREEEVGRLSNALRALEVGRGGMMLLSGEAGVGKTRLATEFAMMIGRRNAWILAADCGESPGRPLGSLARPLQAIADWCRERGAAETLRVFGGARKVLAAYEPSLRLLAAISASEEPAELPPEAARLRLFRCLEEVFGLLAEDCMLVLILDDLHIADELTLDWLAYLARSGRLGDTGTLIVATYRTEESSPALARLVRSEAVVVLPVARLSAESLGAMIADMLAWPALPGWLVDFLSTHTEGNPFFAAEYVRAAVQDGHLRRDTGTAWRVVGDAGSRSSSPLQPLALPGTLRELIIRRLGRLSPPALHLASCASVIGRTVEESLLESVAALSGALLAAALNELVAQQVLAEDENGSLRFAHDKLREVAYDAIAPADKEELHRRAAAGIESLFGAESDTYIVARGHHWEHAGECEKAMACYLEGARVAVRRYSYEQAERLYEAYLRLSAGPSVTRIWARTELATDVLTVRGRTADAFSQHRQALAEARDLGHRVALERVLRQLGVLHQVVGQLDEALRSLAEAIQIARELGDVQAEALGLGNLAITEMDLGRLERANELYELAIAIHRSRGDRLWQGRCLNNLANLRLRQGRSDEAAACYHEARRLIADLGLMRNEAIITGNLGSLEYLRGNLDAACALYEQALALHCRVGDRLGEGLARLNLVSYKLRMGDPEAARKLGEEALSVFREAGERRLEAVTLGLSAQRERLAQGCLSRAAALNNAAVHSLRELDAVLDLAFRHCEQGHIALAAEGIDVTALASAEQTADALGLGPASELRQEIEKLRRAQAGAAAGDWHRLFRGQLVADIPLGLREWLAASGQLPAPAAGPVPVLATAPAPPASGAEGQVRPDHGAAGPLNCLVADAGR